ncbi:hypothetical protein KP509_20G013500 [Ceratopteris richardii]|uniref:Trimethylguanosine synthase n=1 Tax=Ceratopteris richardii TaxID=49495 RepID=A0A8T2SD61_CERRI|nr:hypothetical protein KP509_20G013500 [Ceratopteris richardii]
MNKVTQKLSTAAPMKTSIFFPSACKTRPYRLLAALYRAASTKSKRKKQTKKWRISKKKHKETSLTRRRTDAKELLSGMIEKVSPDILKYWVRRASLFSRFDYGVKCDEQGLFLVTPEEIAKHQAKICGPDQIVIDAFAGVGGNAIQFALRCKYVVAVDIKPTRIKCARNNAKVYGVAHKIDFIVGDFFKLTSGLRADIIFLSPPWGGPSYKAAKVFNIETMLEPENGFSLFRVALSVAPNVVLYLPRTVDPEQLVQLAWLSSPPLAYKVERNYINGYLKALTVYYGNVANYK